MVVIEALEEFSFLIGVAFELMDVLVITESLYLFLRNSFPASFWSISGFISICSLKSRWSAANISFSPLFLIAREKAFLLITSRPVRMDFVPSFQELRACMSGRSACN